jgi:hypothetical protein
MAQGMTQRIHIAIFKNWWIFHLCNSFEKNSTHVADLLKNSKRRREQGETLPTFPSFCLLMIEKWFVLNSSSRLNQQDKRGSAPQH